MTQKGVKQMILKNIFDQGVGLIRSTNILFEHLKIGHGGQMAQIIVLDEIVFFFKSFGVPNGQILGKS